MRMMSAEGFRGLTVVYQRWERWIQGLAVVAVLGLLAALWLLRGALSSLPQVGYPAVFLLSLLGSAAMVVPVPGLLSVCALSLTLVPVLVALVATVAETIGEISGYAVGYGGRRVIERRGFYTRVVGWMERRGVLVIFLISIVPNPFFDVIGIAAGGLRFPLRRFLAIVFAGKIIKNTGVAYACALGVGSIPWLGIG